jgi:hypothetical protein
VQVQVATIDLAKAELTDPVAVALANPEEAALVIWTAKLRTGSAVDKTVNGSKTFNAVAVIASAAEDSAGVASEVADLAAAASGADDDN